MTIVFVVLYGIVSLVLDRKAEAKLEPRTGEPGINLLSARALLTMRSTRGDPAFCRPA